MHGPWAGAARATPRVASRSSRLLFREKGCCVHMQFRGRTRVTIRQPPSSHAVKARGKISRWECKEGKNDVRSSIYKNIQGNQHEKQEKSRTNADARVTWSIVATFPVRAPRFSRLAAARPQESSCPKPASSARRKSLKRLEG